MSGQTRSAEQAAQRLGSGAGRVSRAWRRLPPERRLAAGAAVGLFLTLFLPWYQDTVILGGTGRSAKLTLTSASITGWGAFSFVEAAVLLVAAAVLMLLFMRSEGRAFHVPGGDGGVITAAGIWTVLLIVWRIFDKEGGHSNHGQYLTSTGIEWGIFIALGVAGLLAYAGSRIKVAHEPEPPLPGEISAPGRGAGPAAGTLAQRVPPRTPRPVAAQEPWPNQPPADEAPTRRASADEAPTRQIPSHQAPTELTPADEAPTRRTPADQAPTRRTPPAQAPTRQPPPAGHGFEFPDIQEIEFDDPPTAKLRRSAPARRRPDKPDDQPTIRRRD